MAEKNNIKNINDMLEAFEKEYEESFTGLNTIMNRLNDEDLLEKKENFKKVLSDNIVMDFYEFQPGSKYLTLFVKIKSVSKIKMEKLSELFKVEGNLFLNKPFEDKKNDGSSKASVKPSQKIQSKLTMTRITKISPYLQYFIEFLQDCLNNINFETLNENNPILHLQTKTQKYLISKNLYSANFPTRKVQYSGLGTLKYTQMNIKSLSMKITFFFDNISVSYTLDKKKYKTFIEDSGDKFERLMKWTRENNENYCTTNSTTCPSRITLTIVRFNTCKIYEKYSKDEYSNMDFHSEFTKKIEDKYRDDRILTANFGFEANVEMTFKSSVVSENILSQFTDDDVVEESDEEKEMKIKFLHNAFVDILGEDLKEYFVTKTSNEEVLNAINKLNLPKIDKLKPKIETFKESDDEYDDKNDEEDSDEDD